MALAMSLLLLLLVGVADFGRAFHSYIIITNASREGARYASRFPDDETGITDRTIQEAANSDLILTVGDIQIDNLSGAPGETIRVVVTYEFDTIMSGLVSRVTGSPNLTLQVGTAMVIFGLQT